MELRLQTMLDVAKDLHCLPIVAEGTLQFLHNYVSFHHPKALWKPSPNRVGGYYVVPTTSYYDAYALWIL